MRRKGSGAEASIGPSRPSTRGCRRCQANYRGVRDELTEERRSSFHRQHVPGNRLLLGAFVFVRPMKQPVDPEVDRVYAPIACLLTVFGVFRSCRITASITLVAS